MPRASRQTSDRACAEGAGGWPSDAAADTAFAPTLLESILDHAEENAKAPSDPVTCAFDFVADALENAGADQWRELPARCLAFDLGSDLDCKPPAFAQEAFPRREQSFVGGKTND